MGLGGITVADLGQGHIYIDQWWARNPGHISTNTQPQTFFKRTRPNTLINHPCCMSTEPVAQPTHQSRSNAVPSHTLQRQGAAPGRASSRSLTSGWARPNWWKPHRLLKSPAFLSAAAASGESLGRAGWASWACAQAALNTPLDSAAQASIRCRTEAGRDLSCSTCSPLEFVQ